MLFRSVAGADTKQCNVLTTPPFFFIILPLSVSLIHDKFESIQNYLNNTRFMQFNNKLWRWFNFVFVQLEYLEIRSTSLRLGFSRQQADGVMMNDIFVNQIVADLGTALYVIVCKRYSDMSCPKIITLFGHYLYQWYMT